MQYVNVAVNTKTQKIDQVFTYSIPASLLVNIKVGILVEVPFRNRKLEGVIVAIKQFSSLAIRSKLKPINKIIDQNPVLDPTRLELANWMSNYYLAPIGETIFSMLPTTAKRIVPKDIIKLPPAIHNPRPKIYTLYDNFDNRISDYSKIIRKTIRKNKQVILVFPEIVGKHDIFKKIEGEFDINNIAYLHGNLTRTEHYQNWLDIRSGRKNIIIGSRSAIFAPTANLGLIIIDDSENFGHKEEQSPKYHSVTVAKKIAQISKAHLLLGSSFPSVENYYYEKTGKYHVLKKPVNSHQPTNISIIDSNNDRGIISWKMEQAIEKTLKNNGKVILFVNHRGEGSIYLCSDCGYIFSCPRCDTPLVPYAKSATNSKQQTTTLKCHKCNYQTDALLICPICKGSRFKTGGMGAGLVEKQVKKLFPNKRTLTIDKESVPTLSGWNSNRNIGVDIIIGTRKILDYSTIRADLVGIIGIDSALNTPDYKSNENTFLTLVELVHKANKEIVLQTFSPENAIITYFSGDQSNKFLAQELQKRKDNGYPPFGSLIKLVYQDRDEQKCQEQANKLVCFLKLQISNYKIQIELLGPSPCFIVKKRDKYRYQIILRGRQDQINSILKPLTRHLASWSIDVDPLNLL